MGAATPMIGMSDHIERSTDPAPTARRGAAIAGRRRRRRTGRTRLVALALVAGALFVPATAGAALAAAHHGPHSATTVAAVVEYAFPTPRPPVTITA
jgi:hypothetical protein